MRVIGKVPSLPEFVSQRAYGPPFEPLERWIEDGVGFCHVESRDLFDTQFDNAVASAFAWQRRDEPPIAGVIVPSRDSVGRRFPLLLCEAFVIDNFRVQLAPIALGDYLEDAFAAARDVAALSDRTAIAQRVQTVRLPVSKDFLDAREEYGAWADETPLSVAWSRFVDGDGPAQAELAIAALQRNGFVKLSLGTGAAGAAAFWLQLVERLLNRPTAAFWSVDGRSMVICSNPTPRAFAAVFLPIDEEPAERVSLHWEGTETPVSKTIANLSKASS